MTDRSPRAAVADLAAGSSWPGRGFLMRAAPFLVFLAIMLFGGIAAYVAYQSARSAERAQFHVLAQTVIGRVESRLDQHVSLLQATRAFYIANGAQTDRTSFKRYADRLDPARVLPGIQGLGYASVVATGNEAAVESRIASNYEVTRPVWPETDADIRAVITLLEPSDTRNSNALAYDMFSDPTRRAAMQAAQASGRAAASGPVELVQEISPDKQIGFLVYLPVFSTEVGNPGSGQAAGGLVGFIYAPFRTGDLFNAALHAQGRPPVLIQVQDVTDGLERLIYQDADFTVAEGTDLAVTQTVDVAGRNWRFDLKPAPAYDTNQSGRFSIGIGALLTALAVAMGFLTQAAMLRLEEAKKHQRIAEKDLAQKELILQEMKHRIKNSLGRVLAISRQTLKTATSLEQFHASFSSRLQAMASAQDMLTKSKWQKADLRELLMQELQQVFDMEEVKSSVNGPPVELNEAGAQAFGLVFHELATNALKYGAKEASDLAVSWSIDQTRSRPELVVIWRETLPGGTSRPTETGFGTALIDLNIGTELGGDVNRDFGEEGLRIELRVPMKSIAY